MSGDSIEVVRPLFQEEGDGAIPISPLQLIVTEVNTRTAQRLNAQWHSVLPVTHLGNLVGKTDAVSYVASYRNRFYAVAIWSSPIAGNRMTDGRCILELRRFAISDHAPQNTGSRLLRVMRQLIHRQFPHITKLISYQAVDVHRGTIYKAAGWQAVSQSHATFWHPRTQHLFPQIASDKIRWELAL